MAIKEYDTKQIREIQLVCLDLLKVFDEFCEKNNLRYYVCGGGCIGAIRHGGFIPWDDDIDVMMPRRDYETLKSIWPIQMKDTQYRLNDNSSNVFLRTMWASVSNENTTFIKSRQQHLDISQGIRLDLIPLDGCPEGRAARVIQMFWALMHQIYINQEPPISKGKLLEGIGKIILSFHKSWPSRYNAAKRAEKRMAKYDFDNSKKVTELTTRFHYMKNEYPREAFEPAIRKEFEGFMASLPGGYDTYLSMAFGDYMQLPPEEERVPKHDAVFVDTVNSYKKYRCIEYFKGDE